MHLDLMTSAGERADDVDIRSPNRDVRTRPPIARKAFGALVVLASIFSLLLAVLSYMGRYYFLAELICNFRLQIVLMLLCATAAVFLLGYRRWAGFLLITAVTIGSAFAIALLPGTNPPAGPQTIKLMSFNVLDTNHNYCEAIKRIQSEDPDIVVLIEYVRNWAEQMRELNEAYPHRILEPRWHGFGIAVFSKFPLSDSQIHQLTRAATDVPFVVTQVNVGDQQVQLAAAHLLSPVGRERMIIRNHQLDEIANHLRNTTQPTVLVGDFNCAPWSPFMKELLKATNLRDSRVGFGYHASWPTDLIPMRIPIDHAFVSDSIHVADRRLLGATGSDHLPLILEFSITQ